MNDELARYFRTEATELLGWMAEGVLALDSDPEGPAREHLYRHAHTLKGAARIVGEEAIARLAHDFEDRLAELPRTMPGDREALDALLAIVRAADRVLLATGAPAPGGAPQPPPDTSPISPTQRIDLSAFDALMDCMRSCAVDAGQLGRDVEALSRVRVFVTSLASRAPDPRTRLLAGETAFELTGLVDRLGDGVSRLTRELVDARGRIDRLRLIPAHTIFGQLALAARDAAGASGKHVTFATSGGDIALEGQVLAGLREALGHLVRNAVDHGVETGSERLAAGKSAAGSVLVSVTREGHVARVTCNDDGRGIDTVAVARRAALAGHLDPGLVEALSAEQATQLIFEPGLSTSATVTEISGRGIGLDVVRSVAEQLRGTLDVHSRQGHGTTVTLSVPLSIASLDVLLVEIGEGVLALPLDCVSRVLRVKAGELVVTGHGRHLVEGGQPVPYAPLARVLGNADHPDPEAVAWPVVVIRSDAGPAALGVSRVIGSSGIVTSALPRLAGAQPLVSSMFVDALGDPRPVLRAAALVATLHQQLGTARTTGHVLVVDDSATTRAYELAMLEEAGFSVEQAGSAEEAFAKLSRSRPGLLVVDIDLPGLDGFALLNRLRANDHFDMPPAIIVTSRDTPEDRKRGLEAGARAYLVKGTFEASRFLAIVREAIA